MYLCLEHHSEYDGKTSQSKNYTPDEIRQYRNRLYEIYNPDGKWRVQTDSPESPQANGQRSEGPSDYEIVRDAHKELAFTREPWRFPLWLVANQSDLFAYKAGNRADGICLIERVNLPDGRIVIACIQPISNPGNSITNCVEELCFQVCERFLIPANRLVWLENYEEFDPEEWNIVTFKRVPPKGPFEEPAWTQVTSQLWHELRLRPKKRLTIKHGHYCSKLTKLFPWPPDDLWVG
ncbi:MAG: hypothetical protein WBD87_09725 [Candidatus Acidiferrales bacterium]